MKNVLIDFGLGTLVPVPAILIRIINLIILSRTTSTIFKDLFQKVRLLNFALCPGFAKKNPTQARFEVRYYITSLENNFIAYAKT